MVPPVVAEAVKGATPTEVMPALGCIVPVPLRDTTLGELGALWTKEALPVTLPADVGANRRVKLVFWLDDRVNGSDGPLMLKPLPETVVPVIVRLPTPVLLTKTSCMLLLPTCTLPKASCVALTESSEEVCEGGRELAPVAPAHPVVQRATANARIRSTQWKLAFPAPK
jgi:hypothetical protein